MGQGILVGLVLLHVRIGFEKRIENVINPPWKIENSVFLL